MPGMKRYMLAPLPDTLDSESHRQRRVRFTDLTPAGQAAAAAAERQPGQRAYHDASGVLICAFVIGCAMGYVFNAALMRGLDWVATATGRGPSS